jgi:hypothetical protein
MITAMKETTTSNAEPQIGNKHKDQERAGAQVNLLMTRKIDNVIGRAMTTSVGTSSIIINIMPLR